jgi:hypothetical protein
MDKVVPDAMLFPPPPVRAAMMQSPKMGSTGDSNGVSAHSQTARPGAGPGTAVTTTPPRTGQRQGGHQPSSSTSRAAPLRFGPSPPRAAAWGGPSLAQRGLAGRQDHHPQAPQIDDLIHGTYPHMSQILTEEQIAQLGAEERMEGTPAFSGRSEGGGGTTGQLPSSTSLPYL